MIKYIDTFEEHICNKASLLKTPITGNFELLPLCNMTCKMCYIRLEKKEMIHEGNMLDYNRWIEIAKEAKEMGTLFLLLTGGEPLLYPHFSDLYQELHHMGFIITINSNGTMIDNNYLTLFSQMPPRRLNITLYGASAKTYENLCNYKIGFNKTVDALKNLKDCNIPVKINFSITPYNLTDLNEVYNFLEKSHYVTDYNKPYVLIGSKGEEWTIDKDKLCKTYT